MPFTFSVIVLTAANVGCQCVTWLQTMMKVAVALEVTSPSPPQKAMSTAYNWQMGEHLRTRHLSLLFAPHKILACMTQRTRQIKFTVAKSRMCEHDVRELFHQKGQCTLTSAQVQVPAQEHALPWSRHVFASGTHLSRRPVTPAAQ